MRNMLAPCALVAALLLAPASARGEPMRLDLGLGTAVPVSVGAEATAELPYRILAHVSVGWLPSPYVDLINDIVIAFGGYDETTAELVEAALQDSFVLRLAAGYRPFERAGFEVLAGYTLAALGGGLSTAEVAEAASGKSFSSSQAREVPIDATVHNFQIGVGWRFVFWDRLVVRATLSYLQCFASTTTVTAEAQAPRLQPQLDQAADDLEEYLDDTFTTYIKVPVLGVGAAYRF
ncbi:MAG: hypothetical protein HYY06_25320 [Deltaproteobacteria bacterium]|nr:hypothetical protein [Deltaproteobacteria bacterium]